MGTFGLVVTVVATVLVLFQLWRVLGVYNDDTPKNTAASKNPHLSLVHSSSITTGLTESEQQQFLQGAQQAYVTLIEALFKHNLSSCLDWLAPTVKQQFLAQIDAQEKAGQSVTLHKNIINDVKVMQQSVSDGMVNVMVHYNTTMDYTLHQTNQPDQKMTQNVLYTWTFTKLASAPMNAWQISAVDSIAQS